MFSLKFLEAGRYLSLEEVLWYMHAGILRNIHKKIQKNIS